jgi:hypothetical protein
LADGGRRAALDRDLPPERRYGEVVRDLLAGVLVREEPPRDEPAREEPLRDELARGEPARDELVRDELVREEVVRDPPLA